MGRDPRLRFGLICPRFAHAHLAPFDVARDPDTGQYQRRDVPNDEGDLSEVEQAQDHCSRLTRLWYLASVLTFRGRGQCPRYARIEVHRGNDNDERDYTRHERLENETNGQARLARA